jgi:uncharacterized protein involved in exopolysaccharide biosynthesis
MGGTIEFSDLIEQLRRRRRTLPLWLAVALGAGGVYLRAATPAYMVSARILVQRFALPSDRDSTPHGDREFLATQAEILRSPQVLLDVLKVLPATATPPNEAVDAMLRGLTVAPVVGTEVLTLTYRCPDAPLAGTTVNALVSSYRQYVQRTEREAHAQTLQLLQQTADEYDAELRRFEQEHSRLRSECPVLAQGPDGAAVQRDLLTHLGHKLNEAKNRRIDLESQFQTVRRMPRTESSTRVGSGAVLPDSAPAGTLSNSARVQSVASTAGLPQGTSPSGLGSMTRLGSAADPVRIQQEWWGAHARVAELEQTYGPRHPDLRAARQQVRALERLLRDCVEDLSGSIGQELQAVSLNETELARIYDEELRKLQAIDRYRLQDEQLQAEIVRVQGRRQTIHNELQQRRMDNQLLSEGRAGVVVRVLEHPADPEKVWPRVRLVLSASVLAGLFAAALHIAGGMLLGQRRRSGAETVGTCR